MEWYFRWTENGQAFYKNVAILHGYTEKVKVVVYQPDLSIIF